MNTPNSSKEVLQNFVRDAYAIDQQASKIVILIWTVLGIATIYIWVSQKIVSPEAILYGVLLLFFGFKLIKAFVKSKQTLQEHPLWKAFFIDPSTWVWAYETLNKVQINYLVSEHRSSQPSLTIGFRNGESKKFILGSNKENTKVQDVLKILAELYPDKCFGYSEERMKHFKKDPTGIK